MDSRAEALNVENIDNTGTPADRLAALSRYRITDSPPEAAYDDLARLAAELCDCSSAAIVFSDGERQWVKTSISSDGCPLAPDPGLCSDAIYGSPSVFIPQLTGDRLADGGAGFYAGVVLRTPEGLPLGTLCVMDRRPHQLSERQLTHLQALGRQVMALLESRRSGEQDERSRHRDEQASIREAEERYRALVDLSPQIIWQCDASGSLIFCNRYWCDFTGLSTSESAGWGWMDAVAPDHREAVLNQWNSALKSGQSGSFEVPLLAADGCPRWFQGCGAPVYDHDGRLLHWVLVAQDIHERRRAETERLESEAFTRRLLDAASEGFYSIDTDGFVTLCNEAFVQLLGFDSKEQVLGRQLHQVVRHSHPDGTPYAAEDCPIQRTATTGEPAHVEHELFFRQDGSRLPVEYRVAPLYRDNVLQGAICTFTDISERARGEAQQTYLLELSDRLQESDRRIELDDMMAQQLAQLMEVESIASGRLDERDGLIIDQQWPQEIDQNRTDPHPLGACARTLRLRLSQGLVVPFEDLLDEAGCRDNCGALHDRLGYHGLRLPVVRQPATAALESDRYFAGARGGRAHPRRRRPGTGAQGIAGGRTAGQSG
jgi:PAS domain S-box-containing protein